MLLVCMDCVVRETIEIQTLIFCAMITLHNIHVFQKYRSSFQNKLTLDSILLELIIALMKLLRHDISSSNDKLTMSIIICMV